MRIYNMAKVSDNEAKTSGFIFHKMCRLQRFSWTPVAVDFLNMVIWGWLLVQQPNVPSTDAFDLQEVVMVLDMLACDLSFLWTF